MCHIILITLTLCAPYYVDISDSDVARCTPTPDIITANGFIPVGAGSRVMVSVHYGNVRGARPTLG